ncbi:hypothetical protein BKA82DRAFT_4014740 [Pisolithus tinctorius]|nr:hypothetical protein BKA82DRAFT_4014740 [Pisolithus tinctorius]
MLSCPVSCALHLVLPANLCPWAPRDLDIYVSKRHLSYLSSKLESEACPRFARTAVMNFFSADSIFCGYPNLTFHLLALINPKPVYFRLFGWKSMAAVHKYVTRRSIPRTLTDNGTVWITMDLSRDVGTSGLAFDHLGVLNVLWFMGGYICGTEPTFVKGYTWVIEDDSGRVLWAARNYADFLPDIVKYTQCCLFRGRLLPGLTLRERSEIGRLLD